MDSRPETRSSSTSYSMREDIKSFNISGRGCSMSTLAVDMAQNLLKLHKNSNAVILSTEILSNGWYAGKDRSMMILSCLFRSGATVISIKDEILDFANGNSDANLLKLRLEEMNNRLDSTDGWDHGSKGVKEMQWAAFSTEPV
ncbi:hypothetical protein L1887_37460 [Cichorium endivia]|nr:hypothetical protein L1887_37460 [Cichorium endivia]